MRAWGRGGTGCWGCEGILDAFGAETASAAGGRGATAAPGQRDAAGQAGLVQHSCTCDFAGGGGGREGHPRRPAGPASPAPASSGGSTGSTRGSGAPAGTRPRQASEVGPRLAPPDLAAPACFSLKMDAAGCDVPPAGNRFAGTYTRAQNGSTPSPSFVGGKADMPVILGPAGWGPGIRPLQVATASRAKPAARI